MALGHAGRKFAGLAVLLMLVAVSYFLGESSERLRAEKLEALAAQKPAPADHHSYLWSSNAYMARRGALLKELQGRSFSAGVELSARESNVDHFLDLVRSNETSNFSRLGSFPPSQLFFEAKPAIESSRLFPIFRRMPKGGLLHIHESSSGRCEFVLTNIARRADCFIYWTSNRNDGARGTMIFTNLPPTNYFPAESLRAQLLKTGVSLDDELRRLYMLESSDPHDADIWDAFARWFGLLPQLMCYQPVMRDYLRDAFKTLHEDGISHVDLRVMAPVSLLFDLKGTRYTETDTLRAYVEARDYIRARYNPDFSLKIIMTGYRGYGNNDVTNVVAKTQDYRRDFPDLIVGCDFVGEEDNSLPTLAAAPVLSQLTRHPDGPLNFYFHDGETAWPGNDNLIDAVLLGTKRVGHGFNLFQLPTVEAMVRTNQIAIEVCPISNQLLRLMHDLRVHPALGYMNRGVPCVLGSDDPAIFGNDGLTYDFWEAYYAWGLDLRALKQLAYNSLRFSALETTEQDAALARWQDQWNAWINWVATQSLTSN